MAFSELNLYLPVANMSINFLILITIGLAVGFISGMLGIGGGLITVPILTFIGIPTHVAVISSTNQSTATSFSSYLAHARKNRVDYKLFFILLLGGILGVVFATQLFYYLSKIGQANLFISLSFLLVLSITGTLSTKDVIKIIYYRYRKLEFTQNNKKISNRIKILLTTFPSCKQSISVIVPFITGLVGGILITIGAGGSLITIPIMLYVIGVSPAYTSGTNSLYIVGTNIISIIIQGLLGKDLDIILSTTLIIGSVFSAQLGARFSTRFTHDTLQIILTLIILMLCIKVANDLFIKPDYIYSVEVIHQ